MQPQGQLQVGLRVMQGASPQARWTLPRWRVEGFLIAVEPQCDPAWVLGWKPRAPHPCGPTRARFVWRRQTILRHEGGWCGGSDPRRDGQAVAR